MVRRGSIHASFRTHYMFRWVCSPHQTGSHLHSGSVETGAVCHTIEASLRCRSERWKPLGGDGLIPDVWSAVAWLMKGAMPSTRYSIYIIYHSGHCHAFFRYSGLPVLYPTEGDFGIPINHYKPSLWPIPYTYYSGIPNTLNPIPIPMTHPLKQRFSTSAANQLLNAPERRLSDRQGVVSWGDPIRVAEMSQVQERLNNLKGRS